MKKKTLLFITSFVKIEALAFKQKVRVQTNQNWGVSMRYQLFKLSQSLRGWINYFGIANTYQQCVDLDQWIRRIESCICLRMSLYNKTLNNHDN